MILFLGAAITPPVLLALNVYIFLVVGTIITIGFGLLGWNLSEPVGITIAVAVVVASMFALIRFLILRRRQIVPIDSCSSNCGAKAQSLQRLSRMDVAVPFGFVIPARVLNKLYNPSTKQFNEGQLKKIAQTMLDIAKRRGMKYWIIRSSFGTEDTLVPTPGVFNSIPNVSSTNEEEIIAAIKEVLSSAFQQYSKEYLSKSLSQDSVLDPIRSGSIIVQEQIENQLLGTASSINPNTSSCDEIRIELDLDARQVEHAIYSRTLSRTIYHTEGFPVELWQRETYEQIVKVVELSEKKFEQPVVVEFGWTKNGLWFHQIRTMPTFKPATVWTNTGRAELNVEPLDPIKNDLTYGENLEFLKDAISAAYKREIEVKLINGRPYLRLDMLLFNKEKASSKPNPMAGIPKQFHNHTQLMQYRKLLLRQSRIKTHISYMVKAIEYLQRANELKHFNPVVPWHKWIIHLLDAVRKQQLKLHEKLHDEISILLEETAHELTKDTNIEPELAKFLHLSELSSILPSKEESSKRAKQFETLRHIEVEPVITEHSKAPATVQQLDGICKIELNIISSGTTEAIGFAPMISEEVPKEPYILLCPPSLEWKDLLLNSSGVVFSGNSALSHMALQASSLQLPALCGATMDELKALNGRRILLDASKGKVVCL